MNWYSDSDILQFLQVAFLVEKGGFPAFQTPNRRLKAEIEALVTNMFFVILDSKNSTVEHKHRVVVFFEEICSDSATLAEIFLNYDCALSAVGLFQRIVNTLA